MFEGVGELGGQAAEDRRLTYAWRLRYMLNYNSQIQKFRADTLRMLIIIFTFIAVLVAVLYSRAVDSTVPPSDLSSAYSINVLTRLNLIVPLVITVLRGMCLSIIIKFPEHFLTVCY